jgi:hypothetical protein
LERAQRVASGRPRIITLNLYNAPYSSFITRAGRDTLRELYRADKPERDMALPDRCWNVPAVVHGL